MQGNNIRRRVLGQAPGMEGGATSEVDVLSTAVQKNLLNAIAEGARQRRELAALAASVKECQQRLSVLFFADLDLPRSVDCHIDTAVTLLDVAAGSIECAIAELTDDGEDDGDNFKLPVEGEIGR